MPRTILYLHGLNAGPDGHKATLFRQHFTPRGYDVITPQLPYGKDWIRELLKSTAAPDAAPAAASDSARDGVRELIPRSVAIAFESLQGRTPDLIVGSSLGGGVAMAMNLPHVPMVLIAPVWNSEVGAEGIVESIVGDSKVPGLAGVVGTLAHGVLRSQVPARLGPNTVLVHSRHDRTFHYQQSARLLQANPLPQGSPQAARMADVISALRSEGFCNACNGYCEAANDGRLIVIGASHECNEADPSDRAGHNREPHPHRAMIRAAELLLGG